MQKWLRSDHKQTCYLSQKGDSKATVIVDVLEQNICQTISLITF